MYTYTDTHYYNNNDVICVWSPRRNSHCAGRANNLKGSTWDAETELARPRLARSGFVERAPQSSSTATTGCGSGRVCRSVSPPEELVSFCRSCQKRDVHQVQGVGGRLGLRGAKVSICRFQLWWEVGAGLTFLDCFSHKHKKLGRGTMLVGYVSRE